MKPKEGPLYDPLRHNDVRAWMDDVGKWLISQGVDGNETEQFSRFWPSFLNLQPPKIQTAISCIDTQNFSSFNDLKKQINTIFTDSIIMDERRMRYDSYTMSKAFDAESMIDFIYKKNKLRLELEDEKMPEASFVRDLLKDPGFPKQFIAFLTPTLRNTEYRIVTIVTRLSAHFAMSHIHGENDWVATKFNRRNNPQSPLKPRITQNNLNNQQYGGFNNQRWNNNGRIDNMSSRNNNSTFRQSNNTQNSPHQNNSNLNQSKTQSTTQTHSQNRPQSNYTNNRPLDNRRVNFNTNVNAFTDKVVEEDEIVEENVEDDENIEEDNEYEDGNFYNYSLSEVLEDF